MITIADNVITDVICMMVFLFNFYFLIDVIGVAIYEKGLIVQRDSDTDMSQVKSSSSSSNFQIYEHIKKLH